MMFPNGGKRGAIPTLITGKPEARLLQVLAGGEGTTTMIGKKMTVQVGLATLHGAPGHGAVVVEMMSE